MWKVYIFSIIMIMFILSGCSSKTLNISDLEPSTIVANYDNINAITKEDIITSSKENITLVLENKTEYEYFYGLYFDLEVELDNNWYKIPFDKNPEFKEIGVRLNGNSTNEEKIELSKYFSSLPQGKYRITKSFYLDGEKIDVAAPFEIKNNE